MRVQNRAAKLVMAAGLWLLAYTSYAQFPMAAHLVINGDYDGARAYYLKVLEKDSLNFNANQELGLLLVQYYGDKSEALFYMNRAMRSVKKKDLLTELYLAYAQALHYNSQYYEAIPYYEKIIPTVAGKESGEKIKKQVLLCIENCKYGIKNASDKSNRKAVVKNLGNNINTAYPEFMPVNDPENTTLLYTTKRNLALGDKKDGEDKTHGNMFIAQNLTGKFESGMPFYKPNFQLKFMEGTRELDAVVAISANGEHLLICRNDSLFVTDLSDGKWQPALRLPATINITTRYEGSACISNDGKTIYFAANKPGGFGGNDLYKSVKTASGDWAEGENLGEDINTAEDEDSPFLNFSETVLYYSSRGLDGFGGYDIYKAKVLPQGFGKPVNAGQPLNSPADDIYFTTNKAESEGYFASSRKGGYGDLDLYHRMLFDKPLEQNCIATTNAKPADDVYLHLLFPDSVFVNQPVSFTTLSSHVKDGTILNYFWKVNDALQVSDTIAFAKQFVHEGRYKISLQAAVFSETDGLRKDYCISRELHVFNPQAVDVFFEPLVKANEDKLAIKGTADVEAVKIDTSKKQLLTIKLEPVFFNTGKADLRKDAREAIKRNVAKMNVDGAIVVKLTALTDSRAGKEYNLKLAQKRANSVVAALEKGGIKRKRILAVLTPGEEEADAKKCNGDAACLEKAYQHNRRVEFKVMGAEYVNKPQVLAKKSVKKTSKKK